MEISTKLMESITNNVDIICLFSDNINLASSINQINKYKNISSHLIDYTFTNNLLKKF